jgi:hypothetical protein
LEACGIRIEADHTITDGKRLWGVHWVCLLANSVQSHGMATHHCLAVDWG